MSQNFGVRERYLKAKGTGQAAKPTNFAGWAEIQYALLSAAEGDET